jgi:hypothetical protein
MSEEFSAGVNILLQRMETHPEEFYTGGNFKVNVGRDPKWHSVMVSVMQVKFKESARGEGNFLTEAEIDALYEGYSKIRRKAFDDHVLDAVLNPVGELSSSEDMINKMQGQMGQQKLRASTANNNINTYGLQGVYDVDTHQYQNARGQLSPQHQAVAHAQHITAHQEAMARQGQGLMNAYPYRSSQDSHPQDTPQTQSMLSKMAKGLGLK